jgi:putative endonuclease
MYYVYIIKSLKFPDIVYAGSTMNVAQRVHAHNSGSSVYTSEYKPWELVWYCDFIVCAI